jgi:DNA-binding transcriptional ArsR family regulator
MNDTLDEIERVFLAFGDKTRLRLLNLMQHGEVSVNYLCESLEESQPKVSRHLAYLRTMGMVQTRRDGKWIYYSLLQQGDERFSILIRDTLRWIGSIEQPNGNGPEYISFPLEDLPSDSPIEAADYISGNTDIKTSNQEMEVYLL